MTPLTPQFLTEWLDFLVLVGSVGTSIAGTLALCVIYHVTGTFSQFLRVSVLAQVSFTV